jgi:hypothetical protein
MDNVRSSAIQVRLSKARVRQRERGSKTLAIADDKLPPPHAAHRDYLSLDDPSRDIIRL